MTYDYQRGYEEGRAEAMVARTYAPHVNAMRDAIASWTAAQSDHGHASYWGAAHIRNMRAYWLGMLRGFRSLSTR